MGTLVTLIPVDDEVFATPYCSAFRISARHILSAAHCYKEGEALAFDSHYLVVDGEEKSYRFEATGKGVRLNFTGLPIDAFLYQKRAMTDGLPAPVYLDRLHDFVIWELPTIAASNLSASEDFIDWTKISDSKEELSLYGFPQGAPLAKASGCNGIWQKGVLRHDCDSMPGSSGGLITDKAGHGIALHTTGSADNLWSVYQPGHEFESLSELTTRLENASRPIDAWECLGEVGGSKDCMVSGGRNRALGLAFIKSELLVKAPELETKIEEGQKKAADPEVAAESETSDSPCQSSMD